MKNIPFVWVVVAGLVTVPLAIYFLITMAFFAIDGAKDKQDQQAVCNQLPSYERADRVWRDHQTTARELEQIDPGYIFVSLAHGTGCPEKGFIAIDFSKATNGVKIKDRLGPTFFDIPYTAINM